MGAPESRHKKGWQPVLISDKRALVFDKSVLVSDELVVVSESSPWRRGARAEHRDDSCEHLEDVLWCKHLGRCSLVHAH